MCVGVFGSGGSGGGKMGVGRGKTRSCGGGEAVKGGRVGKARR